MNYHSGENIQLGDLVNIPVPTGTARLRVVMLGGSNKHIEIEPSFLQWVTYERGLAENEVVLEWVDENPFKQDDPNYAPVGNYMFSEVDEHLEFGSRKIT